MLCFGLQIFAATAAAEICSSKVFCAAQDRHIWLFVVCRSQLQRLCRTASLPQLRCWKPCRLLAHLQQASRALPSLAAVRSSRQQQETQQESWTVHSRVHSKKQLGGETAQMGLPCHLSRQALPFQSLRQQGRREAGVPGWAGQPPARGLVLSALCLLRGSLLHWRPAVQSSAVLQGQSELLQAVRRCTWRQGRQLRQRRQLQRGLLPQGPPLLEHVSYRVQLRLKPRQSSPCLASSTTAAALMPRSRSARGFRFWIDVKNMGLAVRFGGPALPPTWRCTWHTTADCGKHTDLPAGARPGQPLPSTSWAEH